MEVSNLNNRKLTDEKFFRERTEVLAEWPTGRDVDLDDGIAYNRNLPDSKVFSKKLAAAKLNGDSLIESYTGTPTIEGQAELVNHVVKEGGADLCSTHVDAFTRNHMYPKAQEAVEESKKLGRAMLNGFPVLIHGVAGNRKLIETYPVPSRISGCSCDWRLNAEIGFAGGHTSITAGPFWPFFGYNRDTPMDVTVRNWQYIYRLMGRYEEKGASVVYRPDGISSGYFICPPSVGDAYKIIEALLGAEQGVRRFSFMSHTGGSLAQDLASALVLPRLGKEYLDKAGFKDAEIFTMCHSMLGRYPYDPARAFAVLSTGPLIAAMAGLQEVCIMTIDEAHEIPRKDHNAASLRCGKMIINLYKGQKLGLEETSAVKTEAWIHEMEVRAIVNKVLELGDGDIAIGTVRATETGALDMPFSGSRYAARRVLGVRDAEGAQRFLDPGNMPFGKEIMDFHREKIAERARKQHREISYEAVIKDLVSVSEGQLVSG